MAIYLQQEVLSAEAARKISEDAIAPHIPAINKSIKEGAERGERSALISFPYPLIIGITTFLKERGYTIPENFEIEISRNITMWISW